MQIQKLIATLIIYAVQESCARVKALIPRYHAEATEPRLQAPEVDSRGPSCLL